MSVYDCGKVLFQSSVGGVHRFGVKKMELNILFLLFIVISVNASNDQDKNSCNFFAINNSALPASNRLIQTNPCPCTFS